MEPGLRLLSSHADVLRFRNALDSMKSRKKVCGGGLSFAGSYFLKYPFFCMLDKEAWWLNC